MDFISANAVIISASILLIAYIFIALEKIPKVTVALIGAGLTILLGLVSQNKIDITKIAMWSAFKQNSSFQ